MGFDQATMGGREEESRGQGSWEVIKHRFESDEKGKQERTKKQRRRRCWLGTIDKAT